MLSSSFLGDLNLNQALMDALQWRNELTHDVSDLSMDAYEYWHLLLSQLASHW